MLRRTSQFLASVVLCAAVGFALVFSGCERAPVPSSKPLSHKPAAYMKDSAFRQKLANLRKARNELAESRGIVVERMTAMIEAKKKELGTDDLGKVKVELEKDPEWNSLYQRCLDANQAIKENQTETFGIVRGRIAPPRQTKEPKISK